MFTVNKKKTDMHLNNTKNVHLHYFFLVHFTFDLHCTCFLYGFITRIQFIALIKKELSERSRGRIKDIWFSKLMFTFFLERL